jgi:hypothetical protein
MGGCTMSELLTVSEVAQIIRQSEDAVTRLFSKMPGVIDLGRAETRHKRRYRVLRIPKAVVEKFLSTRAGHPVRVEAPLRPERRRKSDNWEDRAILNLAKAGLQNEATTKADKAVYARIADKAALLARVARESDWAELLAGWIEDEEV